jgi:NAD(P)-dependent dehydrogenase (short-subunit alcohol dehydrogenase family)
MAKLERKIALVTGPSSGIGQASPMVAPRRLFLRNSGAAVLSGAAVALLGRAALADAATTPQANPHDSAPTKFERSAMPVSPTVNSERRVRRLWSAFSTSQAGWTTGIPSTPTV